VPWGQSKTILYDKNKKQIYGLLILVKIKMSVENKLIKLLIALKILCFKKHQIEEICPKN